MASEFLLGLISEPTSSLLAASDQLPVLDKLFILLIARFAQHKA